MAIYGTAAFHYPQFIKNPRSLLWETGAIHLYFLNPSEMVALAYTCYIFIHHQISSLFGIFIFYNFLKSHFLD